MKKHQTIYNPCGSYSRLVIARLLQRASDDPEKLRWENHARTCPTCTGIIAADREVIEEIRQIPDPAPAVVAGSVMMRIRQGRRTRLLGKRDLVWGASATFAGLIIGVFLSWSDTSTPNVSIGNNGDEFASLTLVDDLDLFVADLVSASVE